MNDLPMRKHPRLKEHDYSSMGYYFVTICTLDREQLLGRIVGRLALKPPFESDVYVELSDIGRVTDKYIQNINNVYDDVIVDTYVIMPDHIHLLIGVGVSGGLRASRPTDEPERSTSVHTVVRSLKRMVNRELGKNIWQSSYFDHVIRNEQDLYETRRYVSENAIRDYFARLD